MVNLKACFEPSVVYVATYTKAVMSCSARESNTDTPRVTGTPVRAICLYVARCHHTQLAHIVNTLLLGLATNRSTIGTDVIFLKPPH